MDAATIYLFLVLPVSVALSIAVGIAKGRVISGFLWGLFFGPIGLLVVTCFLPDLKRKAAKETADQNVPGTQPRNRDS